MLNLHKWHISLNTRTYPNEFNYVQESPPDLIWLHFFIVFLNDCFELWDTKVLNRMEPYKRHVQ